ncbi:MAG: peptidoglycan synthetase, partial [Hymenobacter sp.]
PPLAPEAVQAAFQRLDLRVFTDSKALAEFLHAQTWAATNLLLMTSGTFDGLDLTALAAEVTA